jgi:transposase
MSTLPTLGLDIAKAKFDAALLVAGQVHHRVFANTPTGQAELLAWLHEQGVAQVHVCLEATGTYGDAVAQALYDAKQVVSYINPARLKAFAQTTMTRTKTDKTDAILLARFCEAHQPAAWTPPAPELRELQALVRRVESLQQMRQQESNRLASGVTSVAVRESLEHMLALLDTELAKVQQLIHDHLDQHPHLKEQHALLDSIPGIGDTTATALLAELPNWQTLTSAREVAAHAGLTPKQKLSGSSVHGKPRLSKTGSARLRKILYFPAVVAKTYNPLIKAFCDRLLARGKPMMLVLGAAMRKLLHLIYGVLKSGKPFDPEYRPAAKIAA